MANPATNPGIQTSVNNTPQAVDDLALGQEGASALIDVMANDKGGNAKSLYSVNQTTPTTASQTATTALGGTVQISGDKILYTASGHAIDALAQGETAVDTFSYAIQLGNGTISVAKVSVTITGSNDAPVITSGPAAAAGAVVEAGNLDDGTVAAGVAAAGGTLTSSDVDHGATAAWSGSANGTYGSFAITSAGAWTYTLDNARAATQALAEGETKTETFTATVTDDKGAVATQLVTITVTGTNDAPVITSNAAAASGAVTEAGNLDDGTAVAGVASATGQLASADPDHAATAAWSGGADGAYGSFAIDAATGKWTYTLDNARAATQALAEGETKTETFTATVTDDHGATATQVVTVTVAGTNDSPVVTSNAAAAAGAVVEAGVSAPGVAGAAGQLASSDVDHGATAAWSGSANGAYGAFAINSAGAWSYTLDNARAATQALAEGETKIETFTATVTDDKGAVASQLVTITVTGTNDAPVITSNAAAASGAVTEAGNLDDGTAVAGVASAAGQLASADPDHAATATWSGGADGAYGSFSIDAATGKWTYTLDNARAATQALAEGETKTETFAATVTDDHGATATQVVTVTVAGTNDSPVVTSSAAAAAGAVTEAGLSTAGVALAAGQLASSDVDHGATAAWSGSANGTYGAFAINSAGAWTYSLDNARAATQALAEGETKTETFTATVTDDKGATATQAVTITVIGSNDGPVLAADPVAIHPLTETAGATGSNAPQAAVATLAFTDVDLADHHTVLVGAPTLFWDAPGKPPEIPDATPYAPASLAGVLASALNTSVAEGGGAGTVAASFQVPDKTFDFLGANDTLKITYPVTVDDGHGGTSTQSVTILVAGAEDPVVLGADPTPVHVLNELPNATQSGFQQQFTTTLALSDADFSDDHTVSVSAPTVVWSGGAGMPPGVPGALAGAFNVSEDDYLGAGSVQAHFQAPDGLFDFVGQGETLTVTYNVTVDDGHGSTATRPVTILVNGANDAPRLSADVGVHQTSERPGLTGSSTLDTLSTTLSFSEPDRSDTHTFSVGFTGATVSSGSVPAASTSALANAVALTSTDSTGLGSGSVTATFSAQDKAFDFLAQGETLTANYAVTVNDGHGGVSTQPVKFTIVGTNDAPSVTSGAAAAQGSVQESGLGQPAVLTATGQLTSADPDHNATAAWSLNSTAGAFGAMGINASTGQWTYTLNDGAADKLGAGETRTESFVARVTDDKGASATQTLTVTVNGSNDAPVLAAGPNLSGALSFYGAEGNVVDTIGGNNGTSVGVAYAAGHDGQAFNFTGSNYATIANQIPRDFTLSGWFKTSATAPGVDQFFQGDGLVYADVGGVNPDFGVSIVGNHLAFGSGGGGIDRTILSTSVVTTGDWVNFAVTRAGSVISLYINGTLENAYDTGYLGLLNAPSQITLGANTIDSRYFVGELDDLSVYNRALTATEIQQHSLLGSASMIEASGVSNSAAAVAGSVSLTLTDVDLPDTHTGAIAGPPTITVSGGGSAPAATVSALAGAASVTAIADTTGTGVGSVSVGFSAQDKAFDFLSAGQTLSATYDVVVSDNHGGTAHQPVTFSVTGTNDAPLLAAATNGELVTNGGFDQGATGWIDTYHGGPEIGAASIYGVGPSTNQVLELDSDRFGVDDVKQTVATVAGESYVFSFDAANRAGIAASSNAFQVIWNGLVIDTVTPSSTTFANHVYTVTAAGASSTFEFREIVNDGAGGMIDNVSLTPGFTERAGVTGSSALDTTSTTLSFTDFDLSDHHTVNQVGLPTVVWSGGAAPAGLANALAGALNTSVADSTGTGAGSVTATLSAPDSTFDFLKAGQTLTVTYNLALNDGNGGVSTQPVTFTVAGADDFQTVQLLANNSFESGNPPGQPAALPGWTNNNGLNLEVVDRTFYGVGGDGHWLDTQSTPGGISISQTVDVATGDHATLSFSVAKELNASLGLHPNSTLSFVWDGVVVKSITEADFANWNTLQTFSVDVVGNAGGDTLTITDNGTGQVGYALDWVRVDELVVV